MRSAWRRRAKERLRRAWPGWRTGAGVALIAVELVKVFVLGHEVDKEVVPIGLALILWEGRKKGG